MNEVCIRRADNGWIVQYQKYLSPLEEVYTNEECMLTRVHQLLSKWESGDRIAIIKDQP